MKRRRFLTLTAAALGAPSAALATPLRWRGQALGAEAEITLYGPAEEARKALSEFHRNIIGISSDFSLFDPDSAISRLNHTGELAAPSPHMRTLLDLSDRLHRVTGGRFDPTVQPLWQAMAAGKDSEGALRRVGWHRVSLSPGLRIGPGQALTLNGIAQGYATDIAAQNLARAGFGQALVNIGEFHALGGPFRLGIADPEHGLLGWQSVTGGAVATSSPFAMTLTGGSGHILDPRHGTTRPEWSTVSVAATSAAIADGLSTAFCLMTRDQIERVLPEVPEVSRVTLVDPEGNLSTMQI